MTFKMNHLGWMMVVALLLLTTVTVIVSANQIIEMKNEGDTSSGKIRKVSKFIPKSRR